MVVGVAMFELHLASAQSLKEKRMVVRSIRDRLRQSHSVSAAEVDLQDLHQRVRIGLAFVSLDTSSAESKLQTISGWLEQSTDAELVGWTEEVMQFEVSGPLGIPHLAWSDSEQKDEEEP
jgi:uncharacterized protein YlxP (DUF503 family)